jgi:hypothetical protein
LKSYTNQAENEEQKIGFDILNDGKKIIAPGSSYAIGKKQ